jgi:hypothetical protein
MCQSNKFPDRRDREAFLHPEIFEQEMARFTLAFLNTQVFRLTRPGVGVLATVIEDETWLDAVREGMLISMPHQPHSALPSMVAIFVSHLNTALKLMSQGVWESCIMVVGIMPVEQLMPDEIERHPVVPAAGADGEEEKKGNAEGAGDEAQAVVATAVAEAKASGLNVVAQKPAEAEVEEGVGATATAAEATAAAAAATATAEHMEGEGAKAGATAETEVETETAVAAAATVATAEQLEGKGAKAGAQAEMEVGTETAVAVAAAPAAPAEPKAGLTAASSVALAKTNGSQDKVTFLPLWGMISSCCR